MKKILITLFIIFSTSIARSDNYEKKEEINKMIIHENRFEKLIDLAESYMLINPQFAFNCAYKAQEIADQTNDRTKSAESNIIMGDIFNENNDHTTSISYYEKAIDDLVEIRQYVRACELSIKIAKIHQNNEHEEKWSIKALNNALLYAEKVGDKNIMMKVKLAFGDIYYLQNNYARSKTFYDEVIENQNNSENSILIAKALSRKSNIMIKEGEYKNALSLVDSSMLICDNLIHNELHIINKGLKAEIYDSLNIVDSAKYYYKEAISLAYSAKDYENCGRYMYLLGTMNKRVGDIDNAIKVLNIVCDSTEQFKMYEICNQSMLQMARCYAELGNYEKAYRLFNKYDIYYDSAYKLISEQKLKKMQTSHLLTLSIEERRNKELETDNIKSARINIMSYVTVIIVLFIMLITFIILFSRNKILYHKSKETSYEQQLKIDKMETDLMKIQLNNNKESLINLALHLKSYIDYVNPLKNELKEIIDLPENEQKLRIRNIYTSMQNNSHLFSNTDNLNKQIDDIYTDFLDKLEVKYPNITKSEKRLCAMLYVDMSSKDIAIITNTTLRSVETSRYRLRKKFNLSRDEDMVSFLKNI